MNSQSDLVLHFDIQIFEKSVTVLAFIVILDMFSLSSIEIRFKKTSLQYYIDRGISYRWKQILHYEMVQFCCDLFSFNFSVVLCDCVYYLE